MKFSDEHLHRLTQIAQNVLAPDRIGFDVNIHLSTGLVFDAVRAVVEAICPCTIIEPCSYACTCANPFKSGGCLRCSKYGSEEQRLRADYRLWVTECERERRAWIKRLDQLEEEDVSAT